MSLRKMEREGNIVKLEIEISASEFDKALQKSYLKNSYKYSLPGFRKGKAPAKMIEKHYGRTVFFEDAINDVHADNYYKIIQENKIKAIEYPKVDIIQIGRGQDFIYTAEVAVSPEIVIENYKGIQIEKINIEVTDEDINTELEKLQSQNTRLHSVDGRAVLDGDITEIDFEGFVDGEAFNGGKGEGYSLTIGSGQFIPGFEEQIIGKNIGETFDVNVTFPEEYHNENLAGKPALFKVKVNKIDYSELPVIDDEFAKDISEFDTLEELKADIRKHLEEEASERAKRNMEDAILDKIIDNTEIEVPENMLKKQMETNFKNQLRLFGLNNFKDFDLERHLESMGDKRYEIENSLKEQSTKQIKVYLLIDRISELEGIKAGEEEINKKLEELAANNKLSVEELKERVNLTEFEDSIIMEKTYKFLYENAEIIEKE